MNNLYAIKDTKIGFINSPFIAPNNAAAIRMFADVVRDEKSQIAKHPEDYELFSLGTMNENTGQIEGIVNFLERATSFAA